MPRSVFCRVLALRGVSWLLRVISDIFYVRGIFHPVSAIPDSCGTFPVFPLFVPLPRCFDFHYLILLRYPLFIASRTLNAAFQFSCLSRGKMIVAA